MSTTDPKPLSRVEVWVAEHAVPIFLVITLAIVLGAGAVFYTWQKQGDTASTVHVIQPQVTRINKAICDRRSLSDGVRARACAERIRIGLVNCRRVSRCRAAYLALATYPPPAKPTSPSSSTTAPSSKGVMPQQPSNHGHQQPGPGSPGHGGEDHGQGAPSSGPSPAAPGPAAPEGGPPEETPGSGAQGASPSGVGAEVCAGLVNTCLGAEVGVGH